MATPRFSGWQPARRCTGGAGAGARALMAGMLLRFPGAKSWGIYNCRSTALGNMSAHSEGRALDIGCSLTTGNRIVRFLLRLPPRALGISVIIHNRVIYSAKSPRGRRYTGDPHRDHVHIEMNRRAARVLTLARVKRVIAG